MIVGNACSVVKLKSSSVSAEIVVHTAAELNAVANACRAAAVVIAVSHGRALVCYRPCLSSCGRVIVIVEIKYVAFACKLCVCGSRTTIHYVLASRSCFFSRCRKNCKNRCKHHCDEHQNRNCSFHCFPPNKNVSARSHTILR